METIEQHISPVKAALQLALSYAIGFGTEKDDDKAALILRRFSLQLTDLSNQVQMINNVSTHFLAQDTLYHRLKRQGFIAAFDYVQYFRKRHLLEQAENNCIREIQTLARVFGDAHQLIWSLKFILTMMTASQGQWKEAEDQLLKLVKWASETKGPEHPITLSVMGYLMGTYVDQGQWSHAKELGIRLLRTSERLRGTEHPSTVTYAANLAQVFAHQGDWQNAEILGHK
ncbi:MAG: hypothetical protein Q9209_002016 [Squamulea sp. 1 TL-2023]